MDFLDDNHWSSNKQLTQENGVEEITANKWHTAENGNNNENNTVDATGTITDAATGELWGSVGLNQDHANEGNLNDITPVYEEEHDGNEQPLERSTEEEEDDDTDYTLSKQQWYLDLRNSYNPLSPDSIIVEQLPELSGNFLFKHVNYKITTKDLDSTSTSNTAIRRYSDFLWLRDTLIKRYPFRLIPELPPKFIKFTQNYNNSKSLERRKNGLSIFINLLIKHPVLSKDEYVEIFLTIPIELTNWIKSTILNFNDEFTDLKISQDFKKIWFNNNDILNQWNTADINLNIVIEIWFKILLFIENDQTLLKNTIIEKNLLFSTLLDNLSKKLNTIYPDDNESNKDSIDKINSNLLSIKDSIVTISNNIDNNEFDNYSQNILPNLKKFIILLKSFKNIFNRYRIIGKNDIIKLKKRIEINQQKILNSNNNNNQDFLQQKDKELLQSFIERDKKLITDQSNKAWLIRKCILEEFIIFQETQNLMIESILNWMKFKYHFHNMKNTSLENLLNSLNLLKENGNIL